MTFEIVGYWVMWHGQFIPVWLMWTWVGIWIFSFFQSITADTLNWGITVGIGYVILNILCCITVYYFIRNMALYTNPAVSAPSFHILCLLAIPMFFITMFLTLHEQLIYMLTFRFFGMGCVWGLFYIQFFAMPT